MSFWEASNRFRSRLSPEQIAEADRLVSDIPDELRELSCRLADFVMTGMDTDPGEPWSLELYYPSEYLLKLGRLRERADWPRCLLDDPEVAPYWAHYHVGSCN